MEEAAPPPRPIFMAGPPSCRMSAVGGMGFLSTCSRFMLPMPPATMIGL